jgi:hypothetical protein
MLGLHTGSIPMLGLQARADGVHDASGMQALGLPRPGVTFLILAIVPPLLIWVGSVFAIY